MPTLATERLGVAVPFFVVLMMGCSADPIEIGDAVGTWQASPDSFQWIRRAEDREACVLILRPDGTFEGAVPDYAIRLFPEVTRDLISGEGEWELSQDPAPRVRLRFTEIDRSPANQGTRDLHLAKRGELLTAEFHFIEPYRDRFRYEKRRTHQQSNEPTREGSAGD